MWKSCSSLDVPTPTVAEFCCQNHPVERHQAKAFDTIDHIILLKKLKRLFNVDDSSCLWVESYLHNRDQAVRFNGELSPSYPITAGVPQGSVLGPTLLSMYINDLPQSIVLVDSVLFANDTTIYATGTGIDDITAKLNTAMSRISFWISENGLRLNTQNTKSMLIHPPSKHPPPLVASCNNSLIEQVRTLNYLECLLTST